MSEFRRKDRTLSTRLSRRLAGPAATGDDGKDKARKSIQSVEIGMGILEVLVESQFASMRLKDIADSAGMSSSQVHRYLLAYVNTGLVVQNPATGYYALGPTALKLGLAALSRIDPIRQASDLLDGLVAETGYTGLVTIWGDFGPVIIRYVHGQAPFAMSLNLGSVLPLQASAVGTVYMAFDDPKRFTKLLEQEREGSGRSDSKEIAQRIKLAREKGYASLEGLVIPGLVALAAPIFDMQGRMIATIGLTARSSDKSFLAKKTISKLIEVATKASSGNGWHPS